MNQPTPFSSQVPEHWQTHVDNAAEQWNAWISKFIENGRKASQPLEVHLDKLVAALGTGARKWAQAPGTRSRSPSTAKMSASLALAHRYPGNMVVRVANDLMIHSVRRACLYIGYLPRQQIQDDQAFVKVQFAALRAGLVKAMKSHFPEDVLVEALDMELYQPLPTEEADLRWCKRRR